MIASLIALALAQAGAHGGASHAPAWPPVVIDVENVRSGLGHVRGALCLKEQFLTDDCAYFADSVTVQGVTRLTFPSVAPGTYAAQVFHDVNDNSKVDRGAFGRPLEGVGFSEDAPIGLSGPKFKKAAFRHGDEAQTLRVTLKHFTGRDFVPAESREAALAAALRANLRRRKAAARGAAPARDDAAALASEPRPAYMEPETTPAADRRGPVE